MCTMSYTTKLYEVGGKVLKSGESQQDVAKIWLGSSVIQKVRNLMTTDSYCDGFDQLGQQRSEKCEF